MGGGYPDEEGRRGGTRPCRGRPDQRILNFHPNFLKLSKLSKVFLSGLWSDELPIGFISDAHCRNTMRKMQCSIALCCAILYCTVLYFTVVRCTVQQARASLCVAIG